MVFRTSNLLKSIQNFFNALIYSRMLDRLQKLCHTKELTPSNTTNIEFIQFSVLVVLIAYFLSIHLLENEFILNVAVLCFATHWVGFLCSVLIGSNKYFDIIENLSFLAILRWTYILLGQKPSMFIKMIYVCATTLVFVGYRIFVRGGDLRFKALDGNNYYSFFAWTAGGFWCWMIGMCIWATIGHSSITDDSDDDVTTIAALSAGKKGPGLIQLLGLWVFTFGLMVESIADVQKYNFNKRNTNWIDEGLWFYSRHPNYFGEVVCWLGIAMLCMASRTFSDKLEQMEFILTCLITPIWSLLFLVVTSLMLLEKRADAKWGGLKAYQQYKESTSILLPWFKGNAAGKKGE